MMLPPSGMCGMVCLRCETHRAHAPPACGRTRRRDNDDFADFSTDSGVADDDVEPAVAIHAVGNRAHHRLLVGNVRDRAKRSVLAELLLRGRQLRLVDTDDVDPCAFGRAQPRCREPDPALAPSDERSLVIQPGHSGLPVLDSCSQRPPPRTAVSASLTARANPVNSARRRRSPPSRDPACVHRGDRPTSPLGYHQRPDRERETAASARRFSSRRRRAGRPRATGR